MKLAVYREICIILKIRCIQENFNMFHRQTNNHHFNKRGISYLFQDFRNLTLYEVTICSTVVLLTFLLNHLITSRDKKSSGNIIYVPLGNIGHDLAAAMDVLNYFLWHHFPISL